jgi:gliding motility-associated-like protein
VNTLKGVHFSRGHIFLNEYNFVLGDSTTIGSLTGYDQSRYFVTGAKPTGGVLKYRYLPSGMVGNFPLGPTYKIYSPAQVLNRGPGDSYFARAFSNVYSNATSGPFIYDSILQLTWMLGKANVTQGEALLTLQHDRAEEDPVFNANRLGSYVSLYNDKKWDRPLRPGTPQIPGSISSSFSIPSAMMNSRRLVMNSEPLYLTKCVSIAKKSIIIPNVFSPNGDNINDKWIIPGLVEYENCRVEIYNRYGNLLFTSIGYAQPWDGTFRGLDLPVATYYYIINLKPGDPPLSGSVTILR